MLRGKTSADWPCAHTAPNRQDEYAGFAASRDSKRLPPPCCRLQLHSLFPHHSSITQHQPYVGASKLRQATQRRIRFTRAAAALYVPASLLPARLRREPDPASPLADRRASGRASLVVSRSDPVCVRVRLWRVRAACGPGAQHQARRTQGQDDRRCPRCEPSRTLAWRQYDAASAALQYAG